MEQISISPGNRKVGDVPSISLPLITTCAHDVPCARTCYAWRKCYHLTPQVRGAWDRNWRIWQADPVAFERMVCGSLTFSAPFWFRWHIGGDIPDRKYLAMMVRVARQFPNTRFLAFTKRHGWLKGLDKPSNLALVASMWPGWGEPPAGAPVAWMQDGTETRIPAGTSQCPGYCPDCGICWEGQSVWFQKH